MDTRARGRWECVGGGGDATGVGGSRGAAALDGHLPEGPPEDSEDDAPARASCSALC